MKKYFSIILFFLSSVSVFSQTGEFSLFDIYPAVVDKGSIKQENGQIYMRLHKADNKHLEESPHTIMPDSTYAADVMTHITNVIGNRISGLDKELNAEIENFVNSQPDPDNMDKKIIEDFVMEKISSVASNILMEEFKFSQPLALFFITTFIRNKNVRIETVSFDVIINCEQRTVDYKTIKLKLDNGNIEEQQLTEEKRNIDNSNPLGTSYRLFHKYCD